MKENYIVCNCAKVDYNTIATALETHNKMEDVMEVFEITGFADILTIE